MHDLNKVSNINFNRNTTYKKAINNTQLEIIVN